MSNSLDPDQDHLSPDLNSNCLKGNKQTTKVVLAKLNMECKNYNAISSLFCLS